MDNLIIHKNMKHVRPKAGKNYRAKVNRKDLVEGDLVVTCGGHVVARWIGIVKNVPVQQKPKLKKGVCSA